MPILKPDISLPERQPDSEQKTVKDTIGSRTRIEPLSSGVVNNVNSFDSKIGSISNTKAAVDNMLSGNTEPAHPYIGQSNIRARDAASIPQPSQTAVRSISEDLYGMANQKPDLPGLRVKGIETPLITSSAAKNLSGMNSMSKNATENAGKTASIISGMVPKQSTQPPARRQVSSGAYAGQSDVRARDASLLSQPSAISMLANSLMRKRDEMIPDTNEEPDDHPLNPAIKVPDSAKRNVFGEEIEEPGSRVRSLAESDPRVREALEMGTEYTGLDQLGLSGNTEANDAYMRLALENGASEDELRSIADHDIWRHLGSDLADWEQWALWGDEGFDAAPQIGGFHIPLINGNLLPWIGNLVDPYVRGIKKMRNVPDYTPHVEHEFDALPETMATTIDDGSSFDYNHMTADYMTGTQYRRYVAAGMGGLPIEQIDPTGIYNKRYEMLYNGYTPFTPDDASAWRMAIENVAGAPGRGANTFGSLREMVTPDYTITFDSDTGRRTISGRSFERYASAYINELARENMMDPFRFINTPDDMDGITPIIREYMIPDGSGGYLYAHGMLTGAMRDPDDPNIVMLSFTDGSTVMVRDSELRTDKSNNIMIDQTYVTPSNANGWLPDDLSVMNDIDMITELSDETGAPPLYYAGVQYMPDLALEDGSTMPYSDATRLYYDNEYTDNPENSSDDDIEYGFAPLNINVPRRFQQQEFWNDEGGPISNGFFDLKGNAARNIVDWTLVSIPISFEQLHPWLTSASNATMAMRGVNPGTYDPATHTYRLNAGYYDDAGNLRYGVTDRYGNVDDSKSAEAAMSNTLGTALVPLTERIAGNIGSSPLETALTAAGLYPVLKANPTAMNVLANFAAGAAGEGVEEIIGNYFDELSTYGPTSMYRNQVYDASGNPMYDITGREIREYYTPEEKRYLNALDPADMANAFVGGVGVDLLLGGPGAVTSAIDARRNHSTAAAAASLGNVQGPMSTRVTPMSQEDIAAEAWAYENLVNGRPEDYGKTDIEDGDVEDNVRYYRMPDQVPEGM